MTMDQRKKVEYSFHHSDIFVFTVEDKLYISDDYCKKGKNVIFKNCDEITENEFDSNGNYYGDISGRGYKTIKLKDPFPDSDCCYASIYIKDDIVSLTGAY